MTELYEKSLRKLELDNVLAQLADCANSEDGKDPLPRPAAAGRRGGDLPAPAADDGGLRHDRPQGRAGLP